jgi:hypothetical protein
MRHYLYFWREERPIEPAADSLLDRLAEDRNLTGVDRLSLVAIKDTFRRHFPDIAIADHEWEAAAIEFHVSFSFDDRDQPTSICVSSEHWLADTPEVFDRIYAAMRELGCTRLQSATM